MARRSSKREEVILEASGFECVPEEAFLGDASINPPATRILSICARTRHFASLIGRRPYGTLGLIVTGL